MLRKLNSKSVTFELATFQLVIGFMSTCQSCRKHRRTKGVDCRKCRWSRIEKWQMEFSTGKDEAVYLRRYNKARKQSTGDSPGGTERPWSGCPWTLESKKMLYEACGVLNCLKRIVQGQGNNAETRTWPYVNCWAHVWSLQYKTCKIILEKEQDYESVAKTRTETAMGTLDKLGLLL